MLSSVSYVSNVCVCANKHVLRSLLHIATSELTSFLPLIRPWPHHREACVRAYMALAIVWLPMVAQEEKK